jgi:hypothetical protein
MKDREIKSPAKAPITELSYHSSWKKRLLAELSFMITDIETQNR